jgi:hypothetical protein
MKNFLDYTYQIISKSFQRYLYQIQEKEARKYEEQKLDEIHKKKSQNQLTGRAKFCSTLQDSTTNSKKLPLINGL